MLLNRELGLNATGYVTSSMAHMTSTSTDCGINCVMNTRPYSGKATQEKASWARVNNSAVSVYLCRKLVDVHEQLPNNDAL